MVKICTPNNNISSCSDLDRANVLSNLLEVQNQIGLNSTTNSQLGEINENKEGQAEDQTTGESTVTHQEKKGNTVTVQSKKTVNGMNYSFVSISPT